MSVWIYRAAIVLGALLGWYATRFNLSAREIYPAVTLAAIPLAFGIYGSVASASLSDGTRGGAATVSVVAARMGGLLGALSLLVVGLPLLIGRGKPPIVTALAGAVLTMVVGGVLIQMFAGDVFQ